MAVPMPPTPGTCYKPPLVVPTQLRVIYGDTDKMGVVYYANYLRFFEAGRNEFIRAKGTRYRDVEEKHRIHLPVVEAHVEYRQSARYDDLIIVETKLAEVRRASARFTYRVTLDGQVLVTGHTIHACIDHSGRVQRFPEELSRLLTAG